MSGIKGRSGRQPNERYFAKAITDALKANDYAALHELVDVLVSRARDGDLAAIGMLMDRVDGKPHASMDVDMNVSNLDDAALDARIAQLMDEARVH